MRNRSIVETESWWDIDNMEKSEALKRPKRGEEREREREGTRDANVRRIKSTTISTGKDVIVDFILTGAPPPAKGTSEKVGHGSHELKAACCEMICKCSVDLVSKPSERAQVQMCQVFANHNTYSHGLRFRHHWEPFAGNQSVDPVASKVEPGQMVECTVMDSMSGL